MLDLVDTAFENDEGFFLTPWVFCIMDGMVTGICNLSENGEIIVDYVMIPPEYQ
ncbi:MAG: hypothetical protein QNJ70_18160 [Xenococcaceae cyanobacterium MO_207.B15]|nr:hypothetical protein [Xenococcaceae cyanobacterium MO_207.B15]MDJ0747794.1 hypothetical protein [Xenococcaceae cyanobacterium MO_167.B27]